MEENIKDWFATRVLNPNLILNDIVAAGFNPENTTLRPAEDYISTKKVQEIFTKNGKFDEESFYNTYNVFAKEYEILNNYGIENYILDNYEKTIHQWDVPFGKIKNPNIQSEFRANPQLTAIGITGVNEVSEPLLSVDEAAQRSNIWDPVNKMWLDVTPNDLGFWGVVNNPLVLATNEDGSLKTNNLGNYYYELAGNSENVGKRHLSAFNVITDDLGDWNWVDIFDSDDIEQNAFKTTLKGIATVAAFTIPGIRDIVTYSTAALNLGRALPSMSKSILSIFDENIEFDKLNTWDNVMQTLHTGKSEYSQSRLFTYENIMDFATSSFMQLSQQRAIASLPQRFKAGKIKKAEEELQQLKAMHLLTASDSAKASLLKNPKLLDDLIKNTDKYRHISSELENLSKVSTLISRGYMVATSAEGVYNMSRSYGFDPQTSGFISLLTYGGLAYLFFTNYMRGYLYNTPDYEKLQDIKVITKNFIKNNLPQLKNAQTSNPEVKKKLFGKLSNKFRTALDNHILKVASGKYGIGHGMLAEALEETTEEITQDLAFEIGKQWTSLKELYTGKKYDHNYSWSKTDPLMRYSTAFVGGAIGGGIFKLSDRYIYDRKSFKNWTESLGDNNKLANELVYFLAEGKLGLILDSIDKIDKEMNISKTISAIDGMPTNNYLESQHSVIIGGFKKMVIDLDSFLSAHNLKIEKDTFKNLDIVRNLRADVLITNNLANSLYNDYFGELQNITKLYGKIQEETVKLSATSEDVKKAQHETRIEELNAEIEKRKNNIRNILQLKDDSYLGSLVMRVNQNIADALLPDTINNIAKEMYGKNYDDLEVAFKRNVDARYEELKNSGTLDFRYYKAWQTFKKLATSSRLKNILTSGNIKDDIAGLWGKQLNHRGELQEATLEETIDNNIAFSLLAPIIASTDFSGKKLTEGQSNLLAAKILGVKKIPNYLKIEELSFTIGGVKVNKNQIIQALNDYFNGWKQLVDTAEKNAKEKKKTNLPYKYIPLNNQDQLAIDAYQKFLLEKLNTYEDLSNGAVSNIFAPEYLNDRINFDFVLDAVDEILLELGYENINIRNTLDLIFEKKKQLGNKFKLDAEQTNMLYTLNKGINILKTILASSYDNYKTLDRRIPIGANNFLNEIFKNNQIPVELMILDSATIGGILGELDGVSENINDIIETVRRLERQSTSLDKKASYRYLTQQIDQIRSLFENSLDPILQWDAFDLESLMTKLTIPNENPDDAFYIDNNTIMRNIVLKFEREFYKYFNKLSEGEKIDTIGKIKKLCETSNNITSDTSNLSASSEILFTSVDLYHYLMRISLDHQKKIADVYKEYHDSLTSKCPFDTQEIIITQVLQLLYNNGDLKPWINSMKESIGEDSTLTAAYNIIKLICFGGTGKSSTILPAIYFGIQRLFPNRKCYFIANTDAQKDNLVVNMELSDANSKKLEGELIGVLLNTLGNDSEFKNKYANSIIFIDECTNISQDDLLKLDEMCEKHNVKIIAAGDTSQVGESNNIDKVIGMTTSQLQDSKRTFSDIMTMNMLFWEKMQTGDADSIEYSNEKLFELLYYKEQGKPFEGIYFENPDQNVITGEYLEAFLNIHPLPETLPNKKKHSILIFTSENNDKVLSEKYAKGYNDYEITIVSGKNAYTVIQGAEWDYVFSDVDLNVNNAKDIEIDPELIKNENGTENLLEKGLLQKEAYHQRVKEIYTLVSRARHGFISLKSMTYGVFDSGNSFTVGYNQNNKQSPYPPVDTGISPDVIINYKDYKVKILEGLIYEEDGKSGGKDQGGVQPPTTLKTFDAMNMVQCSPGFVWKNDAELFENMGISRQELDRMKMIIAQALTEDDQDLLKKLPKEWQNGKFLIKFQKTSGKDLEYLGNWGRDDKGVALLHPWLVYSIEKDGERIDIHLGMFHNEKGVKIMPLKQTEPTLKLNALHEKNSKGPIYHQIDFTKIQFRRSRNPISIQNEISVGMHESSLIYKNGKITSKFGDQSYDYIVSSRPIYVREGDISIVNVESLTQVLSEQGSLYADVFEYCVKNGLYKDDEIHNILEVIGTSREINKDTGKVEWKAREPIPIKNEFVSFIKLNVEDNDLDQQDTLKQWSEEYIAEQEAFNKQLKEIIAIAKDNNLIDAEKKVQINSKLSNRIISRVSLLIYGKEYINNKDELNDALTNITNNGGNKNERRSYNHAIVKELWNIFRKCWSIANNQEEIETLVATGSIEGITKDQVESISKIITKYKSGVEEQIRNAKLPEDWFNIDLSKQEATSHIDIIASFISNIKDVYKDLYDFKTGKKLVIALSNIKVNIKSNKKSTNKWKLLTIKTNPKLLKDNGIAIFNSGITIVDKTVDLTDATLSMSGKIVQPGQIHMYVEGSIEDALPEVSSNSLSEIVKPVGIWKRTVQSRSNNQISTSYTSKIDEDGFVYITYEGSEYDAFHFDSEDKSNPDFYIGKESEYQSVELYKEVKDNFLLRGIKILNIVIKPDGTIFIKNDLNIEIPQEAAREIYNAFISESDFKSEPVDPDPFIDPAQDSDFKGKLINALGLNDGIPTSDVIQAGITKIRSLFEDNTDGGTLDTALNYIPELKDKAAEVIYYFLTGNRDGIDSLDEELKNNIYAMMEVLGLNDEDLKNYIEC